MLHLLSGVGLILAWLWLAVTFLMFVHYADVVNDHLNMRRVFVAQGRALRNIGLFFLTLCRACAHVMEQASYVIRPPRYIDPPMRSTTQAHIYASAVAKQAARGGHLPFKPVVRPRSAGANLSVDVLLPDRTVNWSFRPADSSYHRIYAVLYNPTTKNLLAPVTRSVQAYPRDWQRPASYDTSYRLLAHVIVCPGATYINASNIHCFTATDERLACSRCGEPMGSDAWSVGDNHPSCGGTIGYLRLDNQQRLWAATRGLHHPSEVVKAIDAAIEYFDGIGHVAVQQQTDSWQPSPHGDTLASLRDRYARDDLNFVEFDEALDCLFGLGFYGPDAPEPEQAP